MGHHERLRVIPEKRPRHHDTNNKYLLIWLLFYCLCHARTHTFRFIHIVEDPNTVIALVPETALPCRYFFVLWWADSGRTTGRGGHSEKQPTIVQTEKRHYGISSKWSSLAQLLELSVGPCVRARSFAVGARHTHLYHLYHHNSRLLHPHCVTWASLSLH